MTTAQVATSPTSQSTKTCRQCSDVKDISEFGPDHRARDGHRSVCRECVKTQVEAKRAKRDLSKKLADQIAESKNSDELIVALWETGLDYFEVALRVDGFSPQQVERTIAKHRAAEIDQSTREILRQTALLRLDQCYQEALAKGELREARLAVTDQLKAAGIVQQGGNTMKFEFNQTNNVLEERLEKWADQNIVEGEVAESPQLAAPEADTPT